MRTTITIDDELLRAAKKRALERHKSLREIVEQALRAALAEREPEARKPFRLVTFKGRGPLPGVNLDKTSLLLESDDIERMRPSE